MIRQVVVEDFIRQLEALCDPQEQDEEILLDLSAEANKVAEDTQAETAATEAASETDAEVSTEGAETETEEAAEIKEIEEVNQEVVAE